MKGIALEFGRSPQLRVFCEPDEVLSPPSRPALFLVYGAMGGGKTQALLRACKSIQGMVWKHEHSPEWLFLVNEYRRVSTLTEELLKGEANRTSFARPKLRDQFVFYSHKAFEHWSFAEKSEFGDELNSAIDFLSQLVSPEGSAQNPPDDGGSERGLQLARERRDELLGAEKWINAPTVHLQQGGRADSQGSNNTASRLRRRGELLGAWNGREFLHPTFQFHPDTGRLMPEMKTLLAILPKDRSGWRQAFWLFQRHAQINGARPADLFQRDPEAVINAARSDFEVSDERW